LFGFEPVLLPSASLHSSPFSTDNKKSIIAADVLVFPSPFAINASFYRCMAIKSEAQCALPIIAVIGQGSYRALCEEITSNGWARAQEDFQIVANQVEPFDAEHLAPKLGEALKALAQKKAEETSPIFNVLLLRGDKTIHDAQVWQGWLRDNDATYQVIVDELVAYESREIETYSQALVISNPAAWCKSDSVVYFSSSSSVRAFANALPASIDSTIGTPIALTIHTKISEEVQVRLGWKVVEIPVGPQALLHWMSQSSMRL
jgi:uroporphyrinogen-III synthase